MDKNSYNFLDVSRWVFSEKYSQKLGNFENLISKIFEVAKFS